MRKIIIKELRNGKSKIQFDFQIILVPKTKLDDKYEVFNEL